MVDKRMTPQEVIAQIKDGDTIAIGGWGSGRKPMALIREIIRSKLKDLTFISFAGIDIDLLIGAGKVKKLVFPFVSFEGAPAAPGNFRRFRKEGGLELMEVSEYMFIAGLKAAAERLPFYPTRSGLGTDVLTVNPNIVTIKAPYTGEKLVAMPALKADVALLHVNRADPSGYGLIEGDPYLDVTMAIGAEKTFMSAEKIVSLNELRANHPSLEITRVWVTGVVETPNGAHPGSCYPDYDFDTRHFAEYSQATADAGAFKAYLDKYVNVPSEAAYLKLVGKAR